MRKAQGFKKIIMDIKRKAFVKDKSMDDCVIFMTPRDGYGHDHSITTTISCTAQYRTK